MNRIHGILHSFEKIAAVLVPKTEPSDRIKNIMEKAAICPQMLGVGMEEVGIVDKDQIEGGVAEGKSTEEIADEQNVEEAEVEEAIDEGKAVELEHTDDVGVAKEIATDHVAETTPEYYEELGSMENKLETDKEKGLDDPSPEDKEIILRFLQTQSDLDDDTLHKLYMALGVDPHEGEEVVYAAAGDALGDDPAKAEEVAQSVEEKEVELDEPDDSGEVTTEEEQKYASDKVIAALEGAITALKKAAEAPPVSEQKGPDKEDNQKNEEVPTQITDNSAKNLPPKGVSAKADATEERKQAETGQSGEKNEKVAADKPSAGLSKKKKSAIVRKAKKGGDIGKKGKKFDEVAAKAGGGEKGKRIAAAAMWKNADRAESSPREQLKTIRDLSTKLGIIKE